MQNRNDERGSQKISGWYRSWRYFFVLFIIVGLVVVFYAEENWRSRRALEQYKREWAARGYSFEPAAFIPELVPDSQNFALTPLLGPLFEFQPGGRNGLIQTPSEWPKQLPRSLMLQNAY
jgi:hypothetical protein